mmetsp:Transcript_22055/g.62697  ORF Transcript_22055/g.62697 Transcript_22055/m.62697 type:complete len:215 (-) Transcript_22055:144-788(-)
MDGVRHRHAGLALHRYRSFTPRLRPLIGLVHKLVVVALSLFSGRETTEIKRGHSRQLSRGLPPSARSFLPSTIHLTWCVSFPLLDAAIGILTRALIAARMPFFCALLGSGRLSLTVLRSARVLRVIGASTAADPHAQLGFCTRRLAASRPLTWWSSAARRTALRCAGLPEVLDIKLVRLLQDRGGEANKAGPIRDAERESRENPVAVRRTGWVG